MPGVLVVLINLVATLVQYGLLPEPSGISPRKDRENAAPQDGKASLSAQMQVEIVRDLAP
jgi:hypothetical protein